MAFLDPVKVASENYKLLLENEHGRVLEMKLDPGKIDNEHSHNAETVYFISGGTARVHVGEEVVEMEIPDGHTMWHDAWTHRVENVGDTPIHAIIFEPKP